MSDDVWRHVTCVEPPAAAATGAAPTGSGHPPGNTEAAGAVMDREGKTALVLFGGWVGDTASCSARLWCYDLAARAWEPAEVAAGPCPSPRCAHVMEVACGGGGAGSSSSSSAVVFGGESSEHELLGDTWTLSPPAAGSSAWVWTPHPEQPQAPSARRGAAMAAVSQGRFVLFGGMDGTRRLNDLHVLSPVASPLRGDTFVWRPLQASGRVPPPLDAHRLVYHEAAHSVLLLGGYSNADCLQRYTLALTDPPPAAAADVAARPASAVDAAAAAEEGGSGDASAGGGEAAAAAAAAAGLEEGVMEEEEDGGAAAVGGEWVQAPLTCCEPKARSSHTAAIVSEPAPTLVVCLGSHKGLPDAECAEVAEFDLADSKWVSRPFAGEQPVLQPRAGHVTFAVDGGTKLVVFGGYSGTEYLRSSVELEFARSEAVPAKKK